MLVFIPLMSDTSTVFVAIVTAIIGVFYALRWILRKIDALENLRDSVHCFIFGCIMGAIVLIFSIISQAFA